MRACCMALCACCFAGAALLAVVACCQVVEHQALLLYSGDAVNVLITKYM